MEPKVIYIVYNCQYASANGPRRSGSRQSCRGRREQQQQLEAETPPDQVHAGAAERVGEVVLEDALPRHLHERRTGHENRAHRI